MQIDLNCDLGEGGVFDAQIMPFISSCNIACGGHYGTPDSIRKAIRLAKDNTVKIGAHPSYPDQEHFGRQSIHMQSEAFKQSISLQLDTFFTIAEQENVKVNHVKAHGALYNDLAKDHVLSKRYLSILKLYCNTIYVPFKSIVARQALEMSFNVVYEVFADRQYNEDLSLVSRTLTNAVRHKADEVFNHVQLMLEAGEVKTITGKQVPIKAETCCVHGDNPEALELVKILHKLLQFKGYTIG